MALVPGTVFLLTFFLRASQVVDGVRTFTLFDDALISMSYGRTLATTGEWVWFAGADRIQGFTNPLWSLYMALVHVAGADGNVAVIIVSLTGVLVVLLCAVLVGIIVFRTLQNAPSRSLAAGVGAGVVPFLIPLTFWTVRGMEVGLLALVSLALLTGALRVMHADGRRRPTREGALLIVVATVVGVTTRLDFAAVVLAVLLTAAGLAKPGRIRWTLVLAGAIPLLLTAITVIAFQRGYWGDWLPNTYRLKAEGFTLADRLTRGFATAGKASPLLVLVLFSTALVVKRGTRVSRNAALLGAAIVLVTIGYSIWVGGDAWEWSGMVNRYISVGLPAATVTVLLAAGTLLNRPISPRSAIAPAIMLSISGLAYGLTSNPVTLNRGIALGVGALLACGCLALLLALRFQEHAASPRSRVAVVLVAGGLLFTTVSAVPAYLWASNQLLFIETDQDITAASKALVSVTTPNAVIATAWGGAPAYYSQRPMIDLLGKSDRFIATTAPKRPLYPGHDKWDFGHSIRDLRPDVVRELFFESPDDVANMTTWGYVVGCFDGQKAYFLEDSSEVIWSRLTPC